MARILTLVERYDHLQSECEKLVSLLQNREYGLFSWNDAVIRQMIKVQKALPPEAENA